MGFIVVMWCIARVSANHQAVWLSLVEVRLLAASAGAGVSACLVLALQGKREGSSAERRLYGVYKRLCGDGSAWGDGFVPIESALLKGSEQIVLEGAHHFGLKGNLWYGTPSLVEEWWRAVG